MVDFKMYKIPHDLLAQEYLKNEKIQIFIRFTFIIIVVISIYFYKEQLPYSFSYIMFAPIAVFIYNIFYLFVVRYLPYFLQKQRIVLSVLMDITLTVYVMYLVDSLAAYYSGALLWFSVAYGMRYTKTIAYTAYVTVIFSWIVLIATSSFWMQNSSFAIGWLLAYIVLPLYYFRLVDKLRRHLQIVQHYAQESEHKALHDGLTGISNRALFEEELKKYMLQGDKFALFFVDLDAFKEINDHYGHDVGDKVLIEASKRLQNIIANTYRLGGDEFVCIKHYENENELRNIAKNLMFNLSMPCKDSKVVLSGSIGIARFPEDAETEFDIKKRADLAMYAAKQAGKSRYCFYTEVA